MGPNCRQELGRLAGAWLLLLPTVVTSTSLAGWYVPQDLPRLPEVMLNICGAGFVFDPASPCHYHVFGFGIAWNECSYIHRKGAESLQAWKGCVSSCAFTGSLCASACATGVPKLGTTAQECMEECSQATSCLQSATDGAKSQEDASNAAGACLKALRKPAGTKLDPSDSATQKSRAPVIRNLGMFSEGCELLKYNGRWREPLVVGKISSTTAALEQAQPIVKPFYSKEMAGLSQEFSLMTTTIKPPGSGLVKDSMFGPEDGRPPPLPPVLETPPKEIPVRRSSGNSFLLGSAQMSSLS